MHFSELFDELPTDYDLRWLDDGILQWLKPLRRIEAVRRHYDSSFRRVVVWIDPDSDMTQQIEVSMHITDLSVIRTFVARFSDEVPMDVSFFNLIHIDD